MSKPSPTPWCVAALLCLLLAGCGDPQTPQERIAEFEKFNVITDPLTGCQYVQFRGVAPRLDAKGNQICKK